MMSGEFNGSEFRSTSLAWNVLSRVLNSKSHVALLALSYFAGTQNSRTLGTLLKVLVSLGAAVE